MPSELEKPYAWRDALSEIDWYMVLLIAVFIIGVMAGSELCCTANLHIERKAATATEGGGG